MSRTVKSDNSEWPCAIVLSEGMNGLGMLRSLGQEGVVCHLITTSDSAFLAHSRHAKTVSITDTNSDAELLKLIGGFDQRGAVILAGTDRYMDFMVGQRAEISADYALFLPNNAVFNTLVDKKLEIECIRKIGVPLPESHVDIKRVSDRDLVFPQIIKPRTYLHLEELGSKNQIIRSKREFAAFRERLLPHLDHYVMQEVISGGDDCLWICNCTFDEASKLVSVFVFQRLRTTPPHYGVTSAAVSNYHDEIVRHVTTIGRELGYSGPAMFEFKLDPADNVFKYIEINPRVGMCNYFDTKCGVNNVFTAFCIAAGLPYPQLLRQAQSVIFINLLPDAKARLQDGETLSTIAVSYFKYLLHRRVGAYWSWSDPVPAILRLWTWLVRRSV